MSDAELVERARRGDSAAFGTLVDRYQSPVFRAALAALGSRDDAEEVAQDTFLAAYRSLAGFRGDASFKTWVVSIAWRKALTRRRSVKTLLKRLVEPAAESGWEFPDRGRTQEQALLDDELRRRMHHAIGRLTPKLRDTLLLAASGEHTMDDIAALLGVPSGTVKWRVAEARRKVKAALDSTGDRGPGTGGRSHG